MKIGIPYGDKKVPLEIKEENPIKLIYPNEVESVDEEEALLKELENPLGSKSFDDFLNEAKNILFIVNH
ncbi:MAG: lactate racemase domain-containing protein [Candidatus Aerophobetes bacterium]|nr:lactate racemase domain-containing protein [Candidatus Aerophobetes bacterium]